MSLAYLSFVIKHSRVVMLLELRRGEGAYVSFIQRKLAVYKQYGNNVLVTESVSKTTLFSNRIFIRSGACYIKMFHKRQTINKIYAQEFQSFFIPIMYYSL